MSHDYRPISKWEYFNFCRMFTESLYKCSLEERSYLDLWCVWEGIKTNLNNQFDLTWNHLRHKHWSMTVIICTRWVEVRPTICSNVPWGSFLDWGKREKASWATASILVCSVTTNALWPAAWSSYCHEVLSQNHEPKQTLRSLFCFCFCCVIVFHSKMTNT